MQNPRERCSSKYSNQSSVSNGISILTSIRSQDDHFVPQCGRWNEVLRITANKQRMLVVERGKKHNFALFQPRKEPWDAALFEYLLE